MSTLFTFNAHPSQLAIVGLLAFLMTATGCQSSAETSTAIPKQSNDHSSTPVFSDTSQQTLRQQALRIQRALANKDFARITNDIHPTRGVRFSMYAYVRPKTDKVFSREQYARYLEQSNVRFTWGERDGTGNPLVIPLPEYLDTWVNAKQFNDTTISINNFQKSSNSINNLRKVYPNSDFVEFYYSGSEKYDGIDWRVLRLVFDEYQGKRYLVAIINDQWTV
ncbi:hypothetical protein [Psychrobacter namhaensis]|jgi:hypothetical protein|uniref:hypothetical protein n=1 Tax=Psychrobacter namhaensis TaxID=292734 RepID=UPI0018DF06BE|nr:hypothetical protein [Psychrobacter namhaensis]